MAKFQETNPSNSRILIDYPSKNNQLKKPRVEFEYPSKKSPFGVCFSSFILVWMKINLIFLIVNGGLLVIKSLIVKPLDFVTNLTTGYIENLFILSTLGLHMILIPLVTAFLFSKNDQLLKLIPEINKESALFFRNVHYYKKITKIKKKTFEIPIFDNLFLDYKATEDFSEYLYKVEIKEHDFKILTKSIFNKEGKLKNQGDMWYAKFYFTKIPIKGELEIWFI